MANKAFIIVCLSVVHLGVFCCVINASDVHHSNVNTKLTCQQILTNNNLTQPTKDLKVLYDLKKLLCLIGNRMKVGRDVAAFKWINNIPILDAIREKLILSLVVQKAESYGLDRNWSISFFCDQMEANRAVQQNQFERWNCTNSQPQPSTVDLYKMIRPLIDSINTQLIILIKDTTDIRRSDWCWLLTEYESLNVDYDYDFDQRESFILQNIALRSVCD